MDNLSGRIRAHALEGLVLVFAVASVVEVAVEDSLDHKPAIALIALAWSVPFAFRSRYPFTVPVIVAPCSRPS